MSGGIGNESLSSHKPGGKFPKLPREISGHRKFARASKIFGTFGLPCPRFAFPSAETNWGDERADICCDGLCNVCEVRNWGLLVASTQARYSLVMAACRGAIPPPPKKRGFCVWAGNFF